MSGEFGRREFLARVWKWGLAVMGAAGIWTSWDILSPPKTAGAGAKVRTVGIVEVPEEGVLTVDAARAYLTRVGNEVVALSQRCPHLRCRVDWCESSGQFECPCHGSFFNRIGEYRTGPAPRGMDRFEVTVVDGIVVIDTDILAKGAAPGPESIDEPALGPPCTEEEA